MNGSQRIDPDLQADLPQALDPAGARRRRRIRLVPMLPSVLTLGNLFCGFLAIAYTADGVLLAAANPTAAVERIGWAGAVIFLALVFDALDGRVARMTGQVSSFGGQLDSLADMVSFGVAPAFITKALAEQILNLSNHRVTLGFCVFFVLCAALRLARYTVEAEQEDAGDAGDPDFLGLPSPGAAGVVAGIAVFYGRHSAWEFSRYAIQALPYVVPLLGILMISRIPYPHVMNRYFRGSKPMKYLVFTAFLAVVAVILESAEAVVAALLVLYALSGIVSLIVRLVSGRAKEDDLDLFD